MRIRKLELQGFKSFADRAAFHFGQGISGVVGPNGCGKSNVVDAVRWCIGEQSAKSLRGDQMSDVIFAGSSGRSPVGFAEVALTFVATDTPFPGIWQRFPEIEVTRRLYRDGTSEYLVNQEKVRLRDIQELFLDTGVGNRLYSFIEQGRIGQIVQARPEQRRTLIEEAAGISRYKLRRDEALEKLATTRGSLDRVADLADEMGRQLRSVERQVQRSLRARHIGARVRQEELVVALGRFGALVADRRALGERLRAADAELDEATRAVARAEEDLQLRRASLEVLEAEANRARDRLAEVEAQRRVEESAAVYQAREQEQLAERLLRLAADHEAQRLERDAAADEARLREAAGREAASALQDARAELDDASTRLRRAHALVSGARERLEAAKSAATSALEAAVRARGALVGVAARRQELAARAERNRAAAAQIVPGRVHEEIERQRAAVAEAERAVKAAQQAQAAAVGAARAEAEAAVGAARAEAEAGTRAAQSAGEAKLAARLDDARRREAEVKAIHERKLGSVRATEDAAIATVAAAGRAQVEAAREGLRQAEAAALEATRRREAATQALRAAEARLGELLREREGLSARIEALLDMDRRHVDAPDGVKKALAVPGARATLADEIAVPAELESVLARALQGGLDAVVVPDREVAGRVLRAAAGTRLQVVVAGEGEPKGLGAAVRASPLGVRALAVILPDAVEVDSIEAAFGAWAPGRTVVAGEVVLRGDGVLVLGSPLQGVATLRRRREQAELQEKREQLPVAAAEEAVRQARAAIGEDVEERRAVEAARARLREAEDAGRKADHAAADHARAAIQASQEEGRRALLAAQEEGRIALATLREEVARGVEELVERGRAAVNLATEAGRARVDALSLAHREAVQQAEALLGEARHRLREAEAERARTERAAAAVATEEAAIAAAILLVDRDEAEGAAAARSAEAAQEAAELAVRAEQVLLEAHEPELAATEAEVQALRIAVQGHQKDSLAHQDAAAAARARAERAALRVDQIAAERSDVERRSDELALEAAATRTRLGSLGEEQGKVHGELELLRERVREERERVRVVEASTRSARERRDAARDRQVAADGRLTEVRSAIERLRAETEGRHAASLPALLDRLDRDGQILVEGYEPDEGAVELGAEAVPTLRIRPDLLRGDEAELAARARALQSLQEQLAKLGEYSPEAEDEYREVAARQKDLETQRRDLVEAVDIIEKAIAKINKTCRERFRETFDLVNEHFAGIYPRLVGGGSAKLELTDDEDLLTAGVEMLVQPPGKRVQNLALLSGGEKAMAALALIFSLFEVKPSPFCLLDEVDAPLDEGNGARFNDMLRAMSARSQFIVITHNKKTMECADVLYGVTMPEPGTSRLVTVKLD